MQRFHGAAAGGLLARIAERFGPSSSQLRVARGLAPYVWPSDRPDLQATVVLSLVLMLVAKLVTVAMPFTFKWATDALVAASGGAVPADQTLTWLIGAPVLATLLYGLTRIAMSLLVQVREAMFAKVAMHAVRKLALNTFEHMHRLSLRFHLERKTGGLTRVLERGRTRHREHHAHDADDVRADHRRVRAGAGGADVRVRLALRPHRGGDDLALPVVHGAGDRLAHQDPPHHERERHGGQHQGHRQPAELRDGEVLRRRGARGQALRQVDGHLRGGQRQELHLAGRAQRRPGRRLHHGAHGLHGDGGPRRRRRAARPSATS